MRYFRTILAGLGIFFVVGCGGSDISTIQPGGPASPGFNFAGESVGPNPSPIASGVQANPTYPATFDLGKTYRFYAGTILATDYQNVLYGVNDIEIVDAQTIKLKKDDGSFSTWVAPTLTGINPTGDQLLSFRLQEGTDSREMPILGSDSLDIAFYNSIPVRYGSTLASTQYNTNPLDFQQSFYFGQLADPNRLPSAKATYQMLYSNATIGTEMLSKLGLNGVRGGNVLGLSGDGSITVDFQNGTFNGTLFDNSGKGQQLDMTVQIGNGRLVGSELRSELTVQIADPNNPFFAVADSSKTELAGQVSGANAEAVLGAWGGTVTTNSNIGQDNWKVSGSFYGCDPNC